MHWRGKTIVDLSRAFLDTNGVTQHAEAEVSAPDEAAPYLTEKPDFAKNRTVREAWLAMLGDLNICSQKGLVERFDGTIGAGTILAPYRRRIPRQPERSDGRADSRRRAKRPRPH